MITVVVVWCQAYNQGTQSGHILTSSAFDHNTIIFTPVICDQLHSATKNPKHNFKL